MIYVLLAYVIVAPVFYIRFGMKIGSKEEEPLTFNIPIPKKKPKMTQEQERLTKILSNIDNYNGTSAGQEKING